MKAWSCCVAALAGSLFLLAPARDATATGINENDFKARLKDGAQAVDCITCHVGWWNERDRRVQTKLNSFGREYRAWAKRHRDPIDVLLAKDSDGDGVPNGEELKSGSNPGDRDSVAQPRSPEEAALDPTGRLAELIRRGEQETRDEPQKRALLAKFMLALLRGDERTLEPLLGSGGYREIGEKDSLIAKDVIRRWQDLRVTLPKGKPLESFIDCARPQFLTPSNLKLIMPDAAEELLPTQYPVLASLVGQPDFLKGPPVLIMTSRSRKWRVVGGNVLSCWGKPVPASQPAVKQDGNTAKPSTPGRRSTVIPLQRPKSKLLPQRP